MKTRYFISIRYALTILGLYALTIVGGLCLTPVVMADIYSWIDENGVRHYSDTPPPDSKNVEVRSEIPHDADADQRNQDAHQEMVRQVEAELQESEKKELENRLKRTEKKLEAEERKADQALDEAKAARQIAEEKQRRREVYVVPYIGPIDNRQQRPVPYDPYGRPTVPRQ